MSKKIQPTHFSDVTPTTNETVANGYALGQWWQINGTGVKYYHKTDGVWVELKTNQSVNLRTIDKFYHGVVATGQAVKCQSRYVITGGGTTYIYTLASDGTIDSTVAPRTVATAGGLFVTYIPPLDEFWVINATTSIYRISATVATLTATIPIETGTNRFFTLYANGFYYYAVGINARLIRRIDVATQTIDALGDLVSGSNPIQYTYGGVNYIAYTNTSDQIIIRLESDMSLIKTVTTSADVTASRNLVFYNDKLYISNGNSLIPSGVTIQNASEVYDIANDSLTTWNDGLSFAIGIENYMIGLSPGQANRLIKVIDYTGAIIATIYNQDQYPSNLTDAFIYCSTTKMIYFKASSATAGLNNLTLMKL